MYGLKEAGIIAFDQLVRKLKLFGYDPMPHTPGLWRHTSRKTTFTLCVDNFGIQYFSKADSDHLIKAIQDTYECSINWKGTQYCGLTLAWNYSERYVDISMPGYVKKALKNSTTNLQNAQNMPHMTGQPPFTANEHSNKPPNNLPHSSPTCRKAMSPSNHRNLPLLRPQHRFKHPRNPKQDRRPTSLSNNRH